jgi:signal peptidase II
MILLILIVGGVLVLDQLTKLLVIGIFPLYSMRVVIPGFLNLVHARNTGAAFSLLAGANTWWRQALFVGLTIIVLGILLFSYGKLSKNDYWTKTAYALISGGAVGNLVDRLRLGEVVDFLDFYIGSYHWPAFNVADSAITIGACMLLISLVRGR